MSLRKKIYRCCLIVALIITITYTLVYYVSSLDEKIPDAIRVFAGENVIFDFDIPAEADMNTSLQTVTINNSSADNSGKIHFSMDEPFCVNSCSTGSYEMNIKLFGIFNLKKISLEVLEDKKVIPCGNTIGLYVKTNGLMVLGTGIVKGKDGMEYEPAYQILRSGDYITAINGKRINSIDELRKCLSHIKKDKATVTIKRSNVESNVSVPVILCDDNVNRFGVWVREDTQGIGTLTYIDEENNFAALGHGIADVDTGLLMDIESGGIYNSEIVQIVKGISGNPGEIMGMILKSENEKYGDIRDNTSEGIRGTVKRSMLGKISSRPYVPIALKQEVIKGPATILSQIADEVNEYDIVIEDIRIGNKDNKGLVIKVTDEELVKKTGGILQGMSGSPIIQDGKLIGAVTHVFVDDPTKGYGIFIENMFLNN